MNDVIRKKIWDVAGRKTMKRSLEQGDKVGPW